MFNKLFIQLLLLIREFPRGKSKYKQLPCEQFFQQFEISRTFLRAKQVGEKSDKLQFVIDIALRLLTKQLFLF